MASVHSKNLEIYNAVNFIETLDESGEANVYFTFGKCTPWTDEKNPDVPSTSTFSYTDVWRNMIGGKRVLGSDATTCIPRHDWVEGTVYSQYDDRLDSTVLKNPTNAFYVMTDAFDVYKCLYNNNGGPSIVKPTLTPTTEPFQTEDKYIWKYMYSVSSQQQLKFITSDYIPVKTLSVEDGSTQWLVQNNAIDGAIHVCVVTSNGTGYSNNDIFVQITGDGFGANAFAIVDTTTNTISEIVVDNEGYGYTRANCYIYSASAKGVGAEAHAMIAPAGGHGSDATAELGGSYVMISKQLDNSEAGEFSVAESYRQIALIQDPYAKGTKKIFSNTIFSQTTTIALSGTSVNYQLSEYVYQGNSFRYDTFRGTVLEWNAALNQLILIGVDGSPTNDKLIGYSSAAVRTLLAVTVKPELQYNSGKLLYIDNIQPIQRNQSQTEDFRIVLSF